MTPQPTDSSQEPQQFYTLISIARGRCISTSSLRDYLTSEQVTIRRQCLVGYGGSDQVEAISSNDGDRIFYALAGLGVHQRKDLRPTLGQTWPRHPLPIWGVKPARERLPSSDDGNCHAVLKP